MKAARIRYCKGESNVRLEVNRQTTLYPVTDMLYRLLEMQRRMIAFEEGFDDLRFGEKVDHASAISKAPDDCVLCAFTLAFKCSREKLMNAVRAELRNLPPAYFQFGLTLGYHCTILATEAGVTPEEMLKHRRAVWLGRGREREHALFRCNDKLYDNNGLIYPATSLVVPPNLFTTEMVIAVSR